MTAERDPGLEILASALLSQDATARDDALAEELEVIRWRCAERDVSEEPGGPN